MARQTAQATELDELFRTARRDVPSAPERRQLHASVLAAVNAGTAPSPDVWDPSVDSASAVGKLVMKLLGSLGVVAAVTIGATQLRQSPQPASLPAANSATAPAPAVATEFAAIEVATTPPATTVTEPTHPTSLPASDTRIATTSNTRAIQPRSLPSEATLIDQARSELARNPARALALTETHSKLYKKGLLTQEREVIAIEALARLGKARAAEQRGSSFRNQQPHSIHELRLRQVLGDAGSHRQP